MIQHFASSRAAVAGSVATRIKAVSGSNASDWQSGGAHYSAALADFQTALASNPYATPKALLVCLGTNDATLYYPPVTLALGANITSMGNSFRGALGLPNLRVLYAILPVGVGAGKDAAGWAAVRAQQIAMSGTNNMYGVQLPEGTYKDGLHFDDAGAAVAGAAFAAAD